MSVRTLPSVHFAPRHSARAVLGMCWTAVGAMLRAHQTRRLLGEMDDRLLADIGIGRGDAVMEAARPLWDLAPKRR